MVSRRGFVAAVPLVLAARGLLAAGRVEKGVARVAGDARLNGQPAQVGMDVRAGDVVQTFAGGEMVFVVHRDAFLVRANSRVEIDGSAGAAVLAGLRLVSGAVLAVFVSGERKAIRATTATIGIRGTGVYVESQPQRTYVCTCYGEVEIEPAGDPASREWVKTSYHDAPRYVMAPGAPRAITAAPVENHTDAELILLEGLVGRVPAFGATAIRY